MTLPETKRLMAATEATWPAFSKRRAGPFTLREGRGAGRRVSAATAEGPATRAEILAAAEAMRGMGQAPVFSLPQGAGPLEDAIVAAGFTGLVATRFYAAEAARIACLDLPPVAAFPIWPPLAIVEEIWAETEINAARRSVIEAVRVPKTAVLTRVAGRPAGALFIACDSEVAMPHAVVTRPALRGRGAARLGMIAAARWAVEQGARFVGLAVMEGNEAAIRLYEGLGMDRIGGYHYRVLPETPR